MATMFETPAAQAPLPAEPSAPIQTGTQAAMGEKRKRAPRKSVAQAGVGAGGKRVITLDDGGEYFDTEWVGYA